MSPPDDTSTAEREQTDESLRVEREKADNAVVSAATAIDEAADAVIEQARTRADAVLARARRKMDQSAAPEASHARAFDVIAKERALEDETLQHERQGADDVLRTERAAIAAELAKEREETDRDLSRERARADEAVATRDEFLGIVSHDLRNMLGAIIGFAGLIEDEEARTDPKDKVLAFAGRIRRSGGRMNRLVGDLVDLASIHAGSLAVTRELSDPNAVLNEAVDTFHAQSIATRVSVSAEPLASVQVAFDPARILQVLVNLLSNAIKFTPPNGKVVARVERVGDEILFSVRDTGVGIAADKLGAIFERYLQVSTNDRRGVGLGLYISKCIVQGHGGKIWVESTSGVGSTFSFTFPLQVEAQGGQG